MKVIQIPVGPLQNFTYILIDDSTNIGAIVDPADNLEKVFNILDRETVQIKYVINTHGHYDHVLGNAETLSKTSSKLICHESSKIKHDISVKEGDIITLGATEIKIIHTPGHASDSICLLADDKVLTGDTLFIGECGRVDLPDSNMSDMYDSLMNKISNIPDNYEVYPGHDYGSSPTSTMKVEKLTNYTLKPRTKSEFINFMSTP
tara:strand:+ start:108 stop:722 length:615 start_codon:yes stop_codon:yes gene_type:complete